MRHSTKRDTGQQSATRVDFPSKSAIKRNTGRHLRQKRHLEHNASYVNLNKGLSQNIIPDNREQLPIAGNTSEQTGRLLAMPHARAIANLIAVQRFFERRAR